MHDLHVHQPMHDGLADRLQHGIRELCHPVVNPQAIASRVHQADPSQVRQVTRRFGLGNLEALVYMTDADLASEEQPEKR